MDKQKLVNAAKPLDELEMFDLLKDAYPEKFLSEDDETWEAVMDFTDGLSGFDDIADLLGRITMLTMPIESGLTRRLSHCLGRVKIHNSTATMVAAVSRGFATEDKDNG